MYVVDGVFMSDISSINSNDIVGAMNRYADQINADLLVFITEHRSFWQDLTHKSVSKKMHLQSHLPLLIVHLNNDIVEP